MQDNDPTHTSRKAQSFFESTGIIWWHTLPESPDCNLIENFKQKCVTDKKQEPQGDGVLIFDEVKVISRLMCYK